MGLSPGKWIKTVLFGEELYNSNSSKKEVKVEKKAWAEAATEEFFASSSVAAETCQSVDRMGSEGESNKVLPCEVEPSHLDVNLTDDAAREKLDLPVTEALATFRGYLARQAFALQALIQGPLVRRHSVATLRCMQAIVKLQAPVQGQNLVLCKPLTVNEPVHVTSPAVKAESPENNVEVGVSDQSAEKENRKTRGNNSLSPMPLSLEVSEVANIHSKQIDTGTTVIGFLHRGRAIIGGDSLLTNLDTDRREAREHEKTANVSDNIIVGFSGRDMVFIQQRIRSLRIAITEHRSPILVIEAATFLLRKIRERPDLETEMIVGGYDTTGTRLFFISCSEGVIPGTSFFLGSGQRAALETFNKFWRSDTSLRDADLLVRACICKSSERDTYTGQSVRVSSADVRGHRHSLFEPFHELMRTAFRDTRFAEIYPPEIEMEEAAVEEALGDADMMEYAASLPAFGAAELEAAMGFLAIEDDMLPLQMEE